MEEIFNLEVVWSGKMQVDKNLHKLTKIPTISVNENAYESFLQLKDLGNRNGRIRKGIENWIKTGEKYEGFFRSTFEGKEIDECFEQRRINALVEENLKK